MKNLLKSAAKQKKVISDIIQCVVFDNARTKPICASGSRWVSHKLNAMKCMCHLIALTTYVSVKDADRAKLCGYINKCLVIVGIQRLFCRSFVTMCYLLKEDDINVLQAFTT